MKFEELFDMISSPDTDDIMMAVGLFNNHIDEYSEKEMEYMAYLVPSRVYNLLDRRCMLIYAEKRTRYNSPIEYEKSLPQNIYDLRIKVIDNLNFYRFNNV